MTGNTDKNRKTAGILALALGLLTAAFVVMIIVGVEQGWIAKKTSFEGYAAIIVLVVTLFQIPLFVLAALAQLHHALSLFSPREEQAFIPQSCAGERLAAWQLWTAFGALVSFGVWWIALLGQLAVGLVLFALACGYAVQYFVERKILV